MPWSPSDAASKTHKANTPKRQRQWAAIANSELARTGDDATAIKAANGVLARHEFSADEERSMRHSRRKSKS